MLAIASYSHKEAWHIKAVHFVPGSQSRFATCGVEDTKLWTLSGNLLVYQEIYYGIEISKELPVINLCMTFVNQTIITGCDDGSIILWKADPLRTS